MHKHVLNAIQPFKMNLPHEVKDLEWKMIIFIVIILDLRWKHAQDTDQLFVTGT